MSKQLGSYWKVVKTHIPLIKFRKGDLGSFGEILHQTSTSEPPISPKASAYKVITAQTLEEWQVPASYKRPPFTEEEIDYINRGGPE